MEKLEAMSQRERESRELVGKGAFVNVYTGLAVERQKSRWSLRKFPFVSWPTRLAPADLLQWDAISKSLRSEAVRPVSVQSFTRDNEIFCFDREFTVSQQQP